MIVGTPKAKRFVRTVREEIQQMHQENEEDAIELDSYFLGDEYDEPSQPSRHSCYDGFDYDDFDYEMMLRTTSPF